MRFITLILLTGLLLNCNNREDAIPEDHVNIPPTPADSLAVIGDVN